MGCCHFVSFLLSGKRFGVCNTHSSPSRLRFFAQSQRMALVLVEAVIQRGQETREVVYLLRAVHHQIARIGQLMGRNRPERPVRQRCSPAPAGGAVCG
jgi:hypothetical protein